MSDYEYVPSEDSPPPSPSERYSAQMNGQVSDGLESVTLTSQDAIVAELNRNWVQLVLSREVIEGIRKENATLRTEQIDGSDPRLTDFWAQAMELADNANHCDVFDQIAEALGGPRRTREYSVTISGYATVPVTITVSVEARDTEEAEENAINELNGLSSYTISQGAEWYGVELDDDNLEFEVEEA